MKISQSAAAVKVACIIGPDVRHILGIGMDSRI